MFLFCFVLLLFLIVFCLFLFQNWNIWVLQSQTSICCCYFIFIFFIFFSLKGTDFVFLSFLVYVCFEIFISDFQRTFRDHISHRLCWLHLSVAAMFATTATTKTKSITKKHQQTTTWHWLKAATGPEGRISMVFEILSAPELDLGTRKLCRAL